MALYVDSTARGVQFAVMDIVVVLTPLALTGEYHKGLSIVVHDIHVQTSLFKVCE